MHYFSGIVAFVAAVGILYGRANVYPASEYKRDEQQVARQRQQGKGV